MRKLALTLTLGLALTLNAAAQMASITFNWDTSLDTVTNYFINWGRTNASTTNVTACGLVTTYTLTNALVPGQGYFFFLTTADTNGLIGLPSNTLLVTPPLPSPAIAGGFRYTTYLSSHNPWMLSLSWNTVTNIPVASYSLYWGTYSTNSGAYLTTNATQTVAAPATSYTFSNLANYTGYWFWLTAVGSNGVEGPKTTEYRYTVLPIAPRPGGSFRQTITITPQ